MRMNILLFRGRGKARALSRAVATLVLAAFGWAASAQSLSFTGARECAFTGNGVAAPPDVWASAVDAAGLGEARGMSAAVAMLPARYGLPDLRSASAALTVGFGSIGVGFAGEFMGGRLFEQQTMCIGMGAGVAGDCQIGGALVVRREAFERYGSATSLTVDPGCVVIVAPGVRIAASLSNAFGTIAGSPDVTPAQEIRCGASWRSERGLGLMVSARKETRGHITSGIAGEYRLPLSVTLRCGMTDEPMHAGFGGEVTTGRVTFLYAADVHADLGWSHAIEVRWSAGGSE